MAERKKSTVRKQSKKKIPKKVVKTSYKKGKRRKLKLIPVLILFSAIIVALGISFLFLSLPIKNIYVYNNTILKDQEIIELLGLEDYPAIIKCMPNSLENTLKKNVYIKNAKVKRVGLRGISISVKENLPLFYDKNKNKNILLDGSETSDKQEIPVLINYTPDKKYERLKSELKSLDRNILLRISEIEYKPNDVDNGRFILRMNDGNYVYITLIKLNLLNDYINIIKNFGNKKGILYLDSGEYFKVLEE